MPNGPNCMSFLYRHLVIPDLASPTCKSNGFLFYGRTVTSGSNPTAHRRKMRGRPDFASCSIIARSTANCRLPLAKFPTGSRLAAHLLDCRRPDQKAPARIAKSTSLARNFAIGCGSKTAPYAKDDYSKRRISTGRMRDAERAGKIVAAMLINSAAAAIQIASSAFVWNGT
jgi:hypothetical protein